MSASWLYLSLLFCLLGQAVWCDVVARRIPNRLVLMGLIAGVACNLLVPPSAGLFLGGSGGLGAGVALLGALSGLAILLPLYLLRAMGAGDVKLMAAVGAFLGPTQVAGAALLTFIAGGVLSLIAALTSRSLLRVLSNLGLMGLIAISGRTSGMSLRDVQTTGRLPYAIAIAIGTALQLWLAARGGWPFV